MLAPPETPTRLAFGAHLLDLAAQRLLRDGAPVALPPRYFAVLVFLARSGGRLVSKDELLDAVWGHRHVSDSVLKVAVNAVRAALGEDAKAPRHLETVARRGYRFLGVDAAAQPPAPVAASAPAPAARPPAGNLPAVAPGLIGRAADAAQLRQALATHRLVTLHGPGGVGKTRLALAVAGLDAPADGVWLVRLDALADASPLLATVARTLGLGAGADADATLLARALAPLQLRLVLDNAEHLLAAVAELAAALLAGSPGLRLLVTSQVPLRITGEQVLPLAPLSLPDEAGADAAGNPAMALLLARARQLQPDLALDGAAAADAAAICRALDGLPLALELAAARVPLLGFAGVRARLSERLALFTRGDRQAPERHRTLRATLAWACGLLEPAELRLLQRLAVFAGSFTVEGAEAVAGPEAAADLLDLLDTLRERSLLSRADDGPVPRWRLFDSVRAYAAEGLQQTGDEAGARQRLVAYMQACFEQADQRYPATPLLPWLDDLRREVPNLRAALQHALATPALHGAAVALFAASAQFRVRAGWRREALRDHAALLPLLNEATPVLERAAFDLAEAQLGAIAQVLPPAQALASAQRAHAAFSAAGDAARAYLALALESALLIRVQAPPAQKLAMIERLRALEQPGWGPLERRHRAWHEVMLHRESGDYAVFEERAAAYMASGRVLGDEHSAWVAAQALAQVMVVQQRTTTAISLLERAVAEMRERGHLRENAHVLAQWAGLRACESATPAHLHDLQQAVQQMQAEAMLWWMADMLPWPLAHQGRWDDAARVQAWADGLVRARGDRRGPMFGALRQRFGAWLAAQPDASRLQALLDATVVMDEATVVATVFGVGAC